MKKFLVFLVAIVIGTAFAETINIKWKANDTTYATSTCESGGNLIIPQTPPTKYGYTFVGWNYGVITGTWSQSGTPTPTNPIEPVFYQLGDIVLRALGSGENFVADEYNPSTEKITRRVGVLILKGNEGWRENWFGPDSYYWNAGALTSNVQRSIKQDVPICNYYSNYQKWGLVKNNTFYLSADENNTIQFNVTDNRFANQTEFNTWLAERYAAGQPVTCYYPLAEPVEESWSLSE